MNGVMLEYGFLMSAATVLCTLAGTWAVVGYRSSEALAKIASLTQDHNKIVAEMTALRVDLASKYVTSEYLARSEERMMASMSNVAERLDRLTERIDRVFSARSTNQTK